MTNEILATPVRVHQNHPVAVEIWNSTPQMVRNTLIGIVVVTHWVACIVFLYTMFSIYSALEELQKNLQQFGVG